MRPLGVSLYVKFKAFLVISAPFLLALIGHAYGVPIPFTYEIIPWIVLSYSFHAVYLESLWNGRRWIWWVFQFSCLSQLVFPLAQLFLQSQLINSFLFMTSLWTVFGVHEKADHDYLDILLAPFFLWYFFRKNVMEFFHVDQFSKRYVLAVLMLVQFVFYLIGVLLKMLH